MTRPDSHAMSFLSPRVLRRLLRMMAPASLLFLGLLSLLYFQEFSKESALLESDAAHTADLQRDITLRELRTVESDLLYLAEQSILREFLLGGGDGGKLGVEYELFCLRRGTYDQIRFLNRMGMEVIRVNYNNGRPAAVNKAELQSKADRYYFLDAIDLNRGEVFVSPLDLNIERGEIEQPRKPVIRFATPVFDDRGAKQGLLVLNYLGDRLLTKLDEVAGRSPGKFLLLNQDGYYLRGRNADEEWGFVLGVEHAFPLAFTEEWASIHEADRGQISTHNGIFAFRAVRLSQYAPSPRVVDQDSAGVPTHGMAIHDQRLVILSHVPREVLTRRTNRVLRLLLAVTGPAFVLMFLLSWYLAHAGALRDYQKQRIAESESRLRVLATRLLTAQEDERRHMSRELHDDVGQLATTLSLDLQRAAKGANGTYSELLGRAVRDTECLLERVHAISARVRPTLLDDLGLKDAIQSFLSEYQERTGISVSADLNFDRTDLPNAVSENAYRILQEALHNISRHAQVTQAEVQVQVSAECVDLMVRDQGVGFSPESLNNDRLGILGMRERAELLGGTFMLNAQPGAGTEIRVRLPLGSTRDTDLG